MRASDVSTPFHKPITALGGPGYIVALLNISLCVGSFYLLTLAFNMNASSAAPMSLLISHLGCWIAVLCTSGGGVLYRSYSVEDGLNRIARFTVKLSMPNKPTTFIGSNMASSVSSTVSTRGSTMNKLMIGAGFSLGLGLFLKFTTLASRTWVTDMMAFGYVCIILTSYYENRMFDLKDSEIRRSDEEVKRNPAAGRYQSFSIAYEQSTADALRGEVVGPITYLKQKPKPVYSNLHLMGVGCFVGVPFLGYCFLFDEHRLSFYLSLAGLLFGLVFVWMDWELNNDDQTRWLNKEASKRCNIARGVACIVIELCCLILTSAAGVVY